MSINLSSIESENFCAAPWVNIHVALNGGVKPCCYGKTNFGKLQDNNWSYLDGSNVELKDLQIELLNGNKPDYCNGCNEKQWYNEFSNKNLQINDPHDFVLKSTDVRWGNTCQLSCTYCDSFNSSTWAQLTSAEKLYPRTFKNQIKPLFQFLERNKNSIERVSLVGGEPLLLNENIDLLELLPDSVGVEIITNLNVNLDHNKIYQQLIKRNNVHWYVSMETINERFEFVRRRASWDAQVQNLQKLSHEINNTNRIQLQSQYCVYSALNLQELYQWKQSFNNVEINLIAGLKRPEVLNVFLFPDSVKQQAKTELEAVLAYTNLTCFEKSTIESVLQKLNNSFGQHKNDIVDNCIRWHSSQESKYFNNQYDFLTLWPQYRL